jgi:hypothetical protein
MRKYGVGLGSYNFRSNEIGQQGKYIRADCVTFPAWIMRAKDVNEQEVLQGYKYSWDSKDVSSGYGVGVLQFGQKIGVNRCSLVQPDSP